jgi:hypothetical protein
MAKTILKMPLESFAQVIAGPPSPNALHTALAEMTPAKLAIAFARNDLTKAVQKHQNDVLSLLKLVTPGTPVSDAKVKQLRADNVALMAAATIQVQQAGRTRFSLERLYDIARSEEKEAQHAFNKAAPAPESLATVLKDSAMIMSSITDSDGYTTVSHRGGSSTSPPKTRPQRRSPLCSSKNDGARKSPFNNKFLTTFPTTFLDVAANRTAPDEVVAVIPKNSTPGFAGMETKPGVVTALSAYGKKAYEEPASRVSAADFFSGTFCKRIE